MTLLADQQPPLPTIPPAKGRLRLEYLDGLRGLACLYVLLLHARLIVPWAQAKGALAWLGWATRWVESGRQSVAVFIVLSGYCLMLPVARSNDGRLRGGTAEYLKRRAWRILPPYYAALALSLALTAAWPARLAARATAEWSKSMWPAFTPGVILSHLALMHNLRPEWVWKINSPMWTVATEWQIYFIFPLLLLPLWRQWGSKAAVPAAFVLGLLPLLWGRFELAAPWFLGLFALGMAAAALGFSAHPVHAAWRDRLPWGAAAAALFAICLAEAQLRFAGRFFHRAWRYQFTIDVLAGTATACLVIFCTRALTVRSGGARTPAVLRLLESAPVAGLGAFSYSLYLIHASILMSLEMIAGVFQASAASRAAMALLLGVPLSIALSYGFYRVFERPFVRRQMVEVRSTAKQGAAGPRVALAGAAP